MKRQTGELLSPDKSDWKIQLLSQRICWLCTLIKSTDTCLQVKVNHFSEQKQTVPILDWCKSYKISIYFKDVLWCWRSDDFGLMCTHRNLNHQIKQIIIFIATFFAPRLREIGLKSIFVLWGIQFKRLWLQYLDCRLEYELVCTVPS